MLLPVSSKATQAYCVRLLLASALLALPLCGQAQTADATPEQGGTAMPEVLRQLEERGVRIVSRLEIPGGLDAYAGIAQQQPLAIFMSPDGQYAIIGTMMDSQGMDITSQPLEKASIGPWTQMTWQALSESSWVADGSEDAPRTVYMLTDPNCPFCHKFWQQARPWVEAGAVQLRHILVDVLTVSSAGKAAAILSAGNPQEALHAHESAGPEEGIKPLDKIPDAIAHQLQKNRQLMDELQIQGTPGIFYFDSDKQLQIQRGAPLDDHLEQILGPKP